MVNEIENLVNYVHDGPKWIFTLHDITDNTIDTYKQVTLNIVYN